MDDVYAAAAAVDVAIFVLHFPFIHSMIFRNVCAEVIKKPAYQQLY